MPTKTKIFVTLAFIASTGLGIDLILGILDKTYEAKIIIFKTFLIGVFLYYAIKNISNRNA